MRCFRDLAILGISWAALVGSLSAADPPDYSKLLPRIPPMEPSDAPKTFTIAPGFQLQLAASEPNVCSPVAAAIDEEGRMFVVEMRDYPELTDPPLGRIRLLEDADDDGFYEKSTVFADGFSWPTAIACWNGGVFLAAAPDIFYLQDKNGDGKADDRMVVFTGFGKGNVQGLVNSLAWTLDNRISLSTSSGGASVKRTNSAEKLELRGQDMAFDPRSLEMTRLSGGGQHGRTTDSFGRVFVCSNSDHLQQILWEDRYLARNLFFAVPSPRASIAVDGPQADVFRTSPVEPWRVLRTRLRVTGVVPGLIEGGGRDSGYFTSATGVTIYRGDAWKVPDGKLLAIIGDVGGNLIHRKWIEGDGWQLAGKRIDEKSELVMSKDNWFRPVQFVHAPDGSLYVLDMYREVIEHPASLPPDIKKHLELSSGRERGRIWRLAPDGFAHRKTPHLKKASTAELVELLKHPNAWQRETASRLLYARADRQAVEPLRKLATDPSASTLARLHALHALDGMPRFSATGPLDPATLDSALATGDRQLVRAALLLVEKSNLHWDTRLVEQMTSIAKNSRDRSCLVQLALTIGTLKFDARDAIRLQLIRREIEWNEPALKLALQTGLAQGSGNLLSQLVADAELVRSPGGLAWVSLIAKQIGKQQDKDDLQAIAEIWSQLDTRSPLRRTILLGLEPRAGTTLYSWMEKTLGASPESLLAPLLAEARKIAGDRSADLSKRLAALNELKLASDQPSRDLIFELLSPQEPVEIQLAAVDVVSAMQSLDFPKSVQERLSTFGPRVRPALIELLASRRGWLDHFFAAIEERSIAPHEVAAARKTVLLSHADAAIRERAKKLLDAAGSTPRAEVVAAHQDVLKLPGDADRGKESFKKVCAACHQVQGIGSQIGPNLAAMRSRGAEAMLVNLLDPNREVNPQYVTYVVTLKDGRSMSGMIGAETATSLTLIAAEGKQQTLLRGDIEEIRSTGQSLMPEGIEKQYDKQSLADILAFLMKP